MSNPNAIILCIQGQHINLVFLFLTLNRWIQLLYQIGKCPASIYWFTVNKRDIRTMCEICLKFTINIAERRPFLSGVFIAIFEQISLIVLAFPLLALSKQMLAGYMF